MTNKSIQICMEQKKLFIITLLDLTKKIKELNENEEYDSLNEALRSRADYMQRIDKCDVYIENLKLSLVPEEQSMLTQILTSKMAFEKCPVNLLPLLSYQNDYKNLLKEVTVINQQAMISMKEKNKDLLAALSEKKIKNSQYI